MMSDVAVRFTVNPQEPVDTEYTINQQNPIETNFSIDIANKDHNMLDNRDLPDQHPMSAITGLESALEGKQDTLTAGDNIQIEDDVISATDTTYTAGTGISIENGVISNTQTSAEWGNITGDIEDQTDLQNALANKQDVISDLSDIRSGAALGATSIQPNDNITELNNNAGYITGITSSDVTTALGYTPIEAIATGTTDGTISVDGTDVAVYGLGSAAYTASTAYATSAQGALADTALQPNDNVSSLVNDAGYITSSAIPTDYVTTNTAQSISGQKAFSQPVVVADGNGIGSGTILSNKVILQRTSAGEVYVSNTQDKVRLRGSETRPQYNGNDLALSSDIPAAQVNSDWNAVSGVAEILNKPSLATVATTGAYSDLSGTPTIPTVNNATLTIQKNSSDVGTFTANASTDATINITVPTTAADVSALPSSTKYAANLSLSINSSTYVVTAQLKDQDGNNLGSSQTIDLPLESVVVNGSYDDATKKIILTLQNGNTIEFSVADLVSGLQSEITSSNMLDADLVDDSTSTNKFVTTTDISNWNAKQDALTAGTGIDITSNTISNSGVRSVATGATNGTISVNTNGTAAEVSVYGLGSAAFTASTAYDASGAASTAETNAKNYADGLASNYATAAQGALADTAVQPADLATVATTGSYTDLSNKPTIPTVNNATLTITQDGVNKGTFTANASSDVTIALDSGNNLFVATYETTTYSDIVSAYNSGKQVICIVSGVIFYLRYVSVSEVIFFSSTLSFLQIASVTSSNVWSNDFTNIPTKTSDLNNDSGFITSSALSGYATETWVGQQGYITGITSGDVTTALGYTPYDSSNPSGYTSNVGTVTSVNNVSPVSGNVTLSIPTVNDATITITQGGVTKGSFTLNQASGDTIALDAGGGSSYTAGTNITIASDVISTTAAKVTFRDWSV